MLGRVRFAFLGCGAIARKHAEALAWHVENAELVAVCDRNASRAKAFAERYGVLAFGSFGEMMRECGAQIDVVCVLTPTGFHALNVCEVASYQKHVVVEKPMALRTGDALAMIDACQSAGVELFVVKQNRFNRPIQRLRRALEANRFGRLVMVTARVRWRRDQQYYTSADWRGTAAIDGGVMANQASHHIDLVQWMGGTIDSVFCVKACRLAEIEADDTAVAVLRFSSGALGIIEATTATRPKDLEGSVSVIGEGGAVEIGGFAADQIRTWQFVVPSEDDEDTLAHHASNPAEQAFYAHTRYLQNVVDSLRGRDVAAVSGMEGMKTVAILEAMQRSSEANRPVGTDVPADAHASIDVALAGRVAS